MYIYEIKCTCAEGVTKSTRYQRGRVKIALRLYEDDVSGEGAHSDERRPSRNCV